MDKKQLSKRLATVAKYVPKGSRLLDVGSDHAYLPAYLATHHVIEFGIASEVAKGPFTNTQNEIVSNGLSQLLKPRLANGLQAISLSDHINVITISGMGGALIRDILEQGQKKLSNHPLLILQANVDSFILRKWLMMHHYRLTHEAIIDDHHEIYEILVAEWTRRLVHYNYQELVFGPLLLKQKSSVFIKKWQDEFRHLQVVIKQMKRSSHPPIKRIRKIQNRCELIKEVI
ncbi:MAG: tRNA (adenine(22)-N(1))-methyltransferase TrmK [Acetilactobacillus jinshanensis]